jgi:RNA polymerase sigma factor (sigma-70 family)
MMNVTGAHSSSAQSGLFPPTRWSLVVSATGRPSPESQVALDTLCGAYWYPLYAYVRRRGHSPPDAQDLTQEFFLRLLEKRWLDSVDARKGRLRTFLVSAMDRFLAKEWRRASARKRGGDRLHVRMDTSFAEKRHAADLPVTLTADELFDQQWALTVLELTLDRLRAEFVTAQKSADFDVLKGCLMAVRGSIDYPSIAVGLGCREGAARVAVHRLRNRFREVFREEIARTLADTDDLEVEARHLAVVLGRS